MVAQVQTRKQVARFRHTCSVCGQTIIPGAMYERVAMRDESLNTENNLVVVKWHIEPKCPVTYTDMGSR